MQLLYEAALCIWQLTFLDEAAEVIASTSGIVSSLVEIARTAQKEKVCLSWLSRTVLPKKVELFTHASNAFLLA